jgi:hypothetical protein
MLSLSNVSSSILTLTLTLKILIKKGKNDNWEPAHKKLDEKNSENWSWLLKILKNSVFIFIRQRRRLENLKIFSVIGGGGGGSATRLTPLLATIARKYLSIFSSSVPSESAFSTSSYVLRKNRLALSSKNIKYTMFLKDKI